MDSGIWIVVTIVLSYVLYQRLKDKIQALEQQLRKRDDDHIQFLAQLDQLRQELKLLRQAPPQVAPVAGPPVAATTTAAAAPPVAPVVAPPLPPAVGANPVETPAPPAAPLAASPVSASSSPAPPQPVLPPVAVPAAAPATPAALPPTQPAATPQTPPTSPRPEPAVTPPPPPAVPAGPTWWERTEHLLLENWTGILGAVVLVTGVGFLGVYTALRLPPPFRFGLITAFAAALLGLNYFLRPKPFAARLHVWLQSSAAAIFLFACVGAVSVPGLQWAGPPLSYLLLLAGVAANLALAWNSSREAVATLHGVLSLVALSVIPPDLLSLGTAAGITAFCVAITYRQQWRYQLLLSTASFFVFHQYWHYHLAFPLLGAARLTAMALVVLVGGAAAVVQYRRVYADTRFDALLFAAHVLNWTTLGFNLYQYSTGSPWKTIPLALGAGLTFFVARQARRLGIQWLFQTDTIISLLLALATAFSLQGWHATGPVVALFMLLECLLVAFIMGRERENLVFQVASAGALLAGTGLLVLIMARLTFYSPVELHRNALIVLLAAGLGAVYFRFSADQPVLTPDTANTATNQALHRGVGGLIGALYLGVAALLLRALFGVLHPPVGALLGGAAAAAGVAFGLAGWLRGGAAWFRALHLLAGQALLMVAVLGLHKLGLSWPLTDALLYAELLLMTLLLAARREWWTYRVLLYATLALAAALPALVYWSGTLSDEARALLLALPALATAAAQLLLARLDAPAYDLLPFSSNPDYRLRVLGAVPGLLLLAAAGLVYNQLWAPWAAVGAGAGLLLLRRFVPVPGLWVGVLLTAAGFHLLQWEYALFENTPGTPTHTLAYLLPLTLLPAAGLGWSWWAAKEQHVRWPWLYLLGLHLAVTAWAAFEPRAEALPVLLWTALAALAAAGAQWVRRREPTPAALARQGYPDRYLLHVAYCLLGGALFWHLTVMVPGVEALLHLPARRFTAAALLLTLAGLAWRQPPALPPAYRSWRRLHPYLPELTLLLATFTLWHEVQVSWQAPLTLALAFGLTLGAARLPARLRRVQRYGVLFYWLTTVWIVGVALRYLAPGQLLSLRWLTTAGTTALLFAYAATALAAPAPAAPVSWPPGLGWLAGPGRLTPRQLVAALLYPAFVALTVLLVQSFDRSVLTVLLMLEVVGLFVSSLLLRRQDFRYASLAGVAICLVRLVFFDLSQRGTITRAVVFILMGLLLLGMNALYARFKERFAPLVPAGADDDDRAALPPPGSATQPEPPAGPEAD